MPKPTPLSAANAHQHLLAEGPGWDPVTQEAVWVDVARGQILRGTLSGCTVQVSGVRTIDRTVGAAVPALDGGLLVVASNRLVTIGPDGQVHHGPPVIDGHPAQRFNDAACDPAGRLLVGSLALDGSRGTQWLYRIDESGCEPLRGGLTISNGLAWSADGRILYHVDSDPGVVRAIDYEVSTGRLGAERVLVPPASEPMAAAPDGLCVDAEGCLWVAFWGAGQVRRLSPDGVLLEVRDLPAPQISSCAFVGDQLDRLLVTTARVDLTAEQLAQAPASGSVFVLPVDVPGIPRHRWSGNTSAAPPTSAHC